MAGIKETPHGGSGAFQTSSASYTRCRAGAYQPQHEGAPADRVLEVAIGRQPHAAV